MRKKRLLERLSKAYKCVGISAMGVKHWFGGDLLVVDRSCACRAPVDGLT